jgi:hypothetical protein
MVISGSVFDRAKRHREQRPRADMVRLKYQILGF